MLMTSEEYRESLRRLSPKVYLGGKMPLDLRASTGLICIFYALSKKENNIEAVYHVAQ